MLRRALPLFLCASCAQDFSVPPKPEGAPPVVVFKSVAPSPAGVGAVVVIQFTGDAALTECAATVFNDSGTFSENAACLPPAAQLCTCNWSTAAAPEGTLRIAATARNQQGSGSVEVALAVDKTLPAVNMNRISVTRRPAGQRDSITGLADAVTDAGLAYAGRGVRTVDVHYGDVALLVSLTVAADGSFQGEIPLSEGIPDFSPPVLGLVAIDAAGNKSVIEVIPSATDLEGPTGDGTLVEIVRRPAGEPDRVRVHPGAFSDAKCGLRQVMLFGSAGGGNFIGVIDALTDSVARETAIGDAGSAFARVWAAGTDKCGNSGSRVEAQVGVDQSVPEGDGTKLVIDRNPRGAPDGIHGEDDAFSDAVSALRDVRIYAAASGGAPLVVAALDARGQFSQVAIGDASSSYGRLWASATDKCGFEGPRVEAARGKDTQGPVIDGAKLNFVARAGTVPDGISAVAGALSDSTGVVADVRVHDAASDGALLAGPFAPSASGGFSEQSLGVVSVDKVFVQARDKSGNLSARVYARSVQAAFTLEGRTPGSSAMTALAMFSFDADTDPRTTWPGLGAVVGGEISAAASADAAAIDSGRAAQSASSESGPAGSWTVVGPARGDGGSIAMAYDPRRRVTVQFGSALGAVQTHEWDGSTWTAVPTTNRPCRRTNARMTYDADRAVVLLHGGTSVTDSLGGCSGIPPGWILNDTWEYDGANWREIASGPSSSHALAFDAARGRALLNVGGSFTYELDRAARTWRQVTTTGSLPARHSHAMAYDAARARMVVFGGGIFDDGGPTETYHDTYAFDGATWTGISSSGFGGGNGGRQGHSMAYDARRGRVVLFGGGNCVDCINSGTLTVFADSFELIGASWISLGPFGTPLLDAGLAYDSARSTLVAFGGVSGGVANGATREIWLRTAHRRYATQQFLLPLSSSAVLSALSVIYVGSGVGSSTGVSTRGVELLVWRWSNASWERLGSTHAAQDSDLASDRTISGSPAGPLGDYIRGGRIWLQAATLHPSSGLISSELRTDYILVNAAYTIP